MSELDRIETIHMRIALDLNPLGEHPRSHAAQGGRI